MCLNSMYSISSKIWASFCVNFMERCLCNPIKTDTSCLPQNKTGCCWLKVITLINKARSNCPQSFHRSLHSLLLKPSCCSLLLVVSDVNKEADKLSSAIRIMLQLISIIKKIMASAKHWFFSPLSLHSLSSKSVLGLMPLAMNLSHKRLMSN